MAVRTFRIQEERLKKARRKYRERQHELKTTLQINHEYGAFWEGIFDAAPLHIGRMQRAGKIPGGTTVFFVGDSYTYGNALPVEFTFVEVIADHTDPDVRCVSLAIPGSGIDLYCREDVLNRILLYITSFPGKKVLVLQAMDVNRVFTSLYPYDIEEFGSYFYEHFYAYEQSSPALQRRWQEMSSGFQSRIRQLLDSTAEQRAWYEEKVANYNFRNRAFIDCISREVSHVLVLQSLFANQEGNGVLFYGSGDYDVVRFDEELYRLYYDPHFDRTSNCYMAARILEALVSTSALSPVQADTAGLVSAWRTSESTVDRFFLREGDRGNSMSPDGST